MNTCSTFCKSIAIDRRTRVQYDVFIPYFFPQKPMSNFIPQMDSLCEKIDSLLALAKKAGYDIETEDEKNQKLRQEAIAEMKSRTCAMCLRNYSIAELMDGFKPAYCVHCNQKKNGTTLPRMDSYPEQLQSEVDGSMVYTH